MTLQELEKIKERLAKATPGPWWIDSHGATCVTHSPKVDYRYIFIINDKLMPEPRRQDNGNYSPWRNDHDATLIANAPTDIAALIAEVEHAQAREAKLREVLTEAVIPLEVLAITMTENLCPKLKEQIQRSIKLIRAAL